MKSSVIRQKFLDFFKDRGHAVVPSSSLIPDDPSVLLTTAGMQQFKRYFTGELDPLKDFKDKDGRSTRNTTSIQKSFRTSDIDEVGDESHLTFFEMLGNFSFGGYFKEKAIQYGYDFIAKEMGLEIDYASIFEGDAEVPPDAESEEIWESLGIKNIKKFGREDNFWGPTGNEGPCGPTTEIYVRNAENRSIEIWNIVFNEYYKYPDGHLEKLKTPGVDTGMGLERLAMVAQKTPTIFETDLLLPLMSILPTSSVIDARVKRIISDHTRGIVFLISDGVWPSNKGAGYILRRIIRRVITYAYLNNKLYAKSTSGEVDIHDLIRKTVSLYESFYPDLGRKNSLDVFTAEQDRFQNTLDIGLRELDKLENVDAKATFNLYESYGLPYEIVKELGGIKAKNLSREAFESEFKKHQEISRAGQERKFGGHGLILDTGELKAGNEEELKKVTRLHTATHMLQQALREVLGPEVHQAGSDVTAERTRFDFTFPRKTTPEEIKKVEDIVNQKVRDDLPMQFVELPKNEAEKTGALYFFKEKYPDPVKVYFIGQSLAEAWSKEFCGGPHVTHTGEIGVFKIAKEEAVGAGVRRVRGVLTE